MSFTPSSYQQMIFDWIRDENGNAMVNAVAGSGKTTTLVEATKLINSKRVLFAAFNKHIVENLKDRIANTSTCKTIHSIGLQCLRQTLVGKLQDPVSSKYRPLCRNVAAKIHRNLQDAYKYEFDAWLLQADDQDSDPPEDPPSIDLIQQQFYSLIDFLRLTLTPVADFRRMEEMVQHFGIDCPVELSTVLQDLEYILSEGERLARTEGKIDFTDMLWLPYQWKLTPYKYEWILVDEAQDMNAAQLHLVKKMAGSQTRMLFVGDPKQAIYGFSGADSESFQNIRSDISAKEFPLSICYRCPRKVVELAQQIVGEIVARDDSSDGDIFAIEEVDIMRHLQEQDLVLCRKTEPLVRLCLDLLAQKRPATVKGKQIGKSLTSIIREVEKIEGFRFAEFQQFIERYAEAKIAKLLAKPDSEDKIQEFRDQLASIDTCFLAFKTTTLNSFVQELESLFSDNSSAITLSTIHRAKGLEANRVFIIEYDTLPLKWVNQKGWQLDQEYNLKYVAITRAKQSLYLVNKRVQLLKDDLPFYLVETPDATLTEE